MAKKGEVWESKSYKLCLDLVSGPNTKYQKKK